MSNRAKTLLLLFIDLLILIFSLTFIVYTRTMKFSLSAYELGHFHLFSYIFPFWILMYFIEGLYSLKTYNPANLPISLIRGTIFFFIISIIIMYLTPFRDEALTPKTNLFLVAITALPLLFMWRRLFFNYFSHSNRQRNTLLVGSVDTLNIVKAEIINKPHLGYRIVGRYTPDETANFEVSPDVELVAIERNMTKDEELYNKVFSLLGSGIEVMDLAKFAEKISGKIPLRAIDESWFVEYCGHQESRSYDVLKALIDRTTAIILLILLIPIALILLPLLLVVHGRPIFFTQTRTGLNNRPFTIYKLRTMVVDAEKDGAQWAKPKDARVTKLGRILRMTRLDELPQLINILNGDMSLVGPRPERPEIIEEQLAPHIPYYGLRHLVKPGVTGWAQVTFRYGYSQEDAREKLQFDLFYVKNRSLWLDILVILKTIRIVLTGAGQ